MRVQVLSRTLFRLEYAADGNFENRPTLTTGPRRPRPRTQAKTKRLADGSRVIRTERAVLTIRPGTGPLGPGNVALRLRGMKGTAHPAFGAASVPRDSGTPPGPPPPSPAPNPGPRKAGNLGGWYRGLDNQAGPVALHDGILSRDGWYLLDDTISPLLAPRGRWFQPRPPRAGDYQDGYLFAYGRDYAAALRDFRLLGGPAPLLPERAFGVWFSRYAFYSAQALRRLVARFRAEDVPLDVLVLDTDFRWPNPWNGWGWTPAFGPDPAGFARWAHAKGLDLIANVHPSITDSDPRFPAAEASAGGLITDSGRCKAAPGEIGVCRVWDWTRPEHVRSYFDLHARFEADGIDSWWLDWNRDESRADAPGLTPDAWVNSLYARRQRDRGSRWLPLTRVGASMWHYGAAMPGVWAEHRNSIHFTGDAHSTWEMLDFQARFTAAEGSGIGLPYVSHDIGGYTASKLAEDLYVRWVQLGAFQPILRLHSDHGNRLPWEYGPKAERIASGFLRLRESLVPYIYSAAREAHDRGLPIARPMYLEWPRLGGAFKHDRQYMFGGSLLVAPVAAPGKHARKRVWFPPGEWVDIFTGRRHRGPGAKTVGSPLDRMPVFARAGAIIPRRRQASSVARARDDLLRLDVYAGAGGEFDLYEDSGEGFAYERDGFARTSLRWRENAAAATLTIGAARGGYRGMPAARAYEVTVAGVPRPRRVRELAARRERRLRSWSYSAGKQELTVRTGRLPTFGPAAVRLEFGGPGARDRRSGRGS